jgi:D-glycero-D-manno-heptose 1,7-bisphosphate phosphatase
MRRRALFLDRDGVINEDRGYVHAVEEFHWQDGIFEFVGAARRHGYLPVVVTNQSGIARGFYGEEDYAALTRWMCARFEAAGAAIERVYHCPFLPDAVRPEYRANHSWRKPEPGMLLAAAEQLNLDLGGSLMVGDRWSDVAAAAAASLKTIVIVGERSHETAPPALPSSVRLVRCASMGAVRDWFTDFAKLEGVISPHSKKMNSWSPP